MEIFQEIQDLDSFGHSIAADEEDLNTFDEPFLTNDLDNKTFLISNNQVSTNIHIIGNSN